MSDLYSTINKSHTSSKRCSLKQKINRFGFTNESSEQPQINTKLTDVVHQKRRLDSDSWTIQRHLSFKSRESSEKFEILFEDKTTQIASALYRKSRQSSYASTDSKETIGSPQCSSDIEGPFLMNLVENIKLPDEFSKRVSQVSSHGQSEEQLNDSSFQNRFAFHSDDDSCCSVFEQSVKTLLSNHQLWHLMGLSTQTQKDTLQRLQSETEEIHTPANSNEVTDEISPEYSPYSNSLVNEKISDSKNHGDTQHYSEVSTKSNSGKNLIFVDTPNTYSKDINLTRQMTNIYYNSHSCLLDDTVQFELNLLSSRSIKSSVQHGQKIGKEEINLNSLQPKNQQMTVNKRVVIENKTPQSDQHNAGSSNLSTEKDTFSGDLPAMPNKTPNKLKHNARSETQLKVNNTTTIQACKNKSRNRLATSKNELSVSKIKQTTVSRKDIKNSNKIIRRRTVSNSLRPTSLINEVESADSKNEKYYITTSKSDPVFIFKDTSTVARIPTDCTTPVTMGTCVDYECHIGMSESTRHLKEMPINQNPSTHLHFSSICLQSNNVNCCANNPKNNNSNNPFSSDEYEKSYEHLRSHISGHKVEYEQKISDGSINNESQKNKLNENKQKRSLSHPTFALLSAMYSFEANQNTDTQLQPKSITTDKLTVSKSEQNVSRYFDGSEKRQKSNDNSTECLDNKNLPVDMDIKKTTPKLSSETNGGQYDQLAADIAMKNQKNEKHFNAHVNSNKVQFEAKDIKSAQMTSNKNIETPTESTKRKFNSSIALTHQNCINSGIPANQTAYINWCLNGPQPNSHSTFTLGKNPYMENFNMNSEEKKSKASKNNYTLADEAIPTTPNKRRNISNTSDYNFQSFHRKDTHGSMDFAIENQHFSLPLASKKDIARFSENSAKHPKSANHLQYYDIKNLSKNHWCPRAVEVTPVNLSAVNNHNKQHANSQCKAASFHKRSSPVYSINTKVTGEIIQRSNLNLKPKLNSANGLKASNNSMSDQNSKSLDLKESPQVSETIKLPIFPKIELKGSDYLISSSPPKYNRSAANTGLFTYRSNGLSCNIPTVPDDVSPKLELPLLRSYCSSSFPSQYYNTPRTTSSLKHSPLSAFRSYFKTKYNSGTFFSKLFSFPMIGTNKKRVQL